MFLIPTFFHTGTRVIPGDPTDILRSESFLDGSDHHDGAAPEQLPTDLGSAGRRG